MTESISGGKFFCFSLIKMKFRSLVYIEDIQYFLSFVYGKLNIENGNNSSNNLCIKIYGERSETSETQLKDEYRVSKNINFSFYPKEDIVFEHFKIMLKNVGKV
jgi:hypothetical protein